MASFTRFFPVIIFVLPIFITSCGTVLLDPQIIRSPDAARPIGDSSQAIKTKNTLYISGQLGIEPRTEQLVPGGILAETQQALRNIDALLKVSEYTSKDVVQLQVFLTNLNDYQTVQMVFDRYFHVRPPVVNFVEVNRLPLGGIISIVATASR